MPCGYLVIRHEKQRLIFFLFLAIFLIKMTGIFSPDHFQDEQPLLTEIINNHKSHKRKMLWSSISGIVSMQLSKSATNANEGLL